MHNGASLFKLEAADGTHIPAFVLLPSEKAEGFVVQEILVKSPFNPLNYKLSSLLLVTVTASLS